MELTRCMIHLVNYYVCRKSISDGLLISDGTLTRFGLAQDGYVEDLTEQGILVYKGDGDFDIVSDEFLFQAGLKMIETDWLSDDEEFNHESAVKCLKFVIMRNSSYTNKLDELLNQDILNGSYDRFTLFYDVLRLYNPQKLNYYLLLIARFYPLPPEYLEKAKSIKKSSILVKDGTTLDKCLNESRSAALQGKYPFALKSIRQCLSNRNLVEDQIEEELIVSARNKEIQVRKKVCDLVRQENYAELVHYLEELKEKIRISVVVRGILQVARAIIDMQNGVSLEIEDRKVRTIFNAIFNNNFVLAHQMCSKDNNSDISVALRRILYKASVLVQRNALDEKMTAYVKELYEELLKRKTIVISKPLSDDEISCCLSLGNSYPDMIFRAITDYTDRKRIVLKYCQKDENYTRNDLYNIAEDYARSGKLESSCDYYIMALASDDYLSPGICAKIANCLAVMGENEEALDFYTVVHAINNEKGLPYNFYNRILELEGLIEKIDSEEVKPNVAMSNEDWTIAGIQNDFGIPNFDNISTAITVSGLSFEDTCRGLNLTDEEIDLVKLRYAREFYKQGFFDRGDKYIREVEHSPNKTEKVKAILNAVRSNKKFYQYKK